MKNFTFKKISSDDIPLIHSWLTKPHVQEFWSENTVNDLEAFRKKMEGKIKEKGVNPFLVVLQGKPIGYIQSYSIDSKTAGIDQFIGVEEFVNKGLGSMFVKEFTDDLLKSKKFTRIVTDPSVLNFRAVKALEKAGYKRLSASKNFENDEVVLMEKKTKKAS